MPIVLTILSTPSPEQSYLKCFFFQAEDGIRDLIVTGVQTCALPISQVTGRSREVLPGDGDGAAGRVAGLADAGDARGQIDYLEVARGQHAQPVGREDVEIGRASCGKECRSRWSPYH